MFAASVNPHVRTLRAFLHACRRQTVRPTPWMLFVNVAAQSMHVFRLRSSAWLPPQRGGFELRSICAVSTSKFGTGQIENSNRTPLGLHRVAKKIGGGYPIGTVFRERRPVGTTWQGLPNAPIVHRILWLEGLEPGWNRGGQVDSFRRYIYLHGFSDETTLGRAISSGCIHVAAKDLLPLYDLLPVGTLVWIAQN